MTLDVFASVLRSVNEQIANILPEDLTGARSGVALKIWRAGMQTNVITIADWYSSDAFQIESFRIGSSLITERDLNLLVSSTPTSMSQMSRATF